MSNSIYLPGEERIQVQKKEIKKVIKSDNFNNLDFVEKFEKQGKQGIAGVLNCQLNDSDFRFVYKISQYLNNTIAHEACIMESLNSLKSFCPHFCTFYGKINHKVDANYRKIQNPFKIKTKKPIFVETLFMEEIVGEKFYNFLKTETTDRKQKALYSIIKQILLAIYIAQTKKKFTHYDLHSCNILLKKCDKDAVFLYKLSPGNCISIATFGYYPIIIDFGFSFIEDLNGKGINSSLAHTNVGFMTNQFDMLSDPKLFLVSVSDEIKRYMPSQNANILRNIVKNNFEPLDIDWECGWDNYDYPGAADFVLEKLQDIDTSDINSDLFTNCDHFCIDIIQSLVILPLKPADTENIDLEIAYKTMVSEFSKIEKCIGSRLYNLYIFKCIVDIIGEIKDFYENAETREDISKIVEYFKGKVLENIRSIASFCIPKKLNYERLMCSVLCVAKCTEEILYEVIQEKNQEKEVEYSEVDLNTPVKIYAAIEVNIPQKYEFTSNTKVYVFDCVDETRDVIEDIPKDVRIRLNKSDVLLHGNILEDILD
jgi:hypothetical protein